MIPIALKWSSNLRVNLVIWPTPSPNISTLLRQNGNTYDENAFLAAIPAATGDKTPNNTRTVRNTVEVLELSGLAQRDATNVYRLTNLGALTAQFFGIFGTDVLANENNIELLGRHFLCGLTRVAEYRTILHLMLLCDGRLSNEELNRTMPILTDTSKILQSASAVANARELKDPAKIGPRYYQDSEFADASKRSEQRKAMNPWFLLAGGGGLVIDLDSDPNGFRVLYPWAKQLITELLVDPATAISFESKLIADAIDKGSSAAWPTNF